MIETLPMPMPGDPVKADHIRTLSLALKKRTPQPSPSLRLKSTANGFTYEAVMTGGGAGGSVGEWHNFQPSRVNAELITLSPGTINGNYPTIGGTSINTDPRPQLTIVSTTGTTNIVYAVVTFTLTTDNGFVTGFTGSSYTIESYTSAQSNTATKRYIELFRWRNGALLSTTQYWNIGLRAEDSGSASSNAVWVQWNS